MKPEKHPLCKQCAYFHRPFVPSEGPLDAELVLCGDSPWINEGRAGRPFVGDAGQTLDLVLEETGIDRRDVFLTNVVRCQPEALGQAHPSEVVELCTKLYLKKELERIKPKLIVPMGNVALKALGVRQ